MANYEVIVETILIIGIGMYMHLNRISVIDLKYSKLPGLRPNAASSLFVFSTLCILTKLRNYWWPNCLKKPSKILTFLIELCLSLYATDLLVRQLWIPVLRLLNYACGFLGRYILVGNQEFLAHNASPIANWIHNEGYYSARFCLALSIFIFMTEVTGFSEMMKQGIHTMITGEKAVNPSVMSLTEVFNLDEYAALIESMGEDNKESVQKRRKLKRNPSRRLHGSRRKVNLNTQTSTEYQC